ncbi:hypothetical protein [Rhizobium sp. NFACC06-2]|uniref:hypothetical protein n=1 Tax=Rhizobium sp. NFACC06-2 TaxID=1566264 RepID=UPI00122C2D39|nr:hypothetical protein [Rhizobium sp. NFACC06-2]
MHDDWNLPVAASVVGPGPIPTYHVVDTARAAFKLAMTTARRLQAAARKRQGQVAVLCMDFERFETYQNAASHQFPQEVFIIRSRDDVEQLRYMNRRIVFSTPEYVAGLQFDSVVIVDANGDLVPLSNYKGHQERRFLSELYLGISRAQKEVVIIASRDGDGLSPYLQALEPRGLLQSAT